MTSTIETGERRREPWRELGITGGAVAAVVVVVLVVVAVVESWSAEAWAALATWTTAGVAVAAGAVALGQLGEARRLRFEQAQPYVVAFMEPSGAGSFFIDLVVRNFGATAAHDVRLEITPTPQRSVMDPAVWLPESIPVLVPGQEWRTFWDSGKRWESDLPTVHEAAVVFKDSQGKSLPPLRSVLDWGALKDRAAVEVYGPHHAAKALRDISKTMGAWQRSGYQGVSVVTCNGDAEAERRRRRRDAKEAEEPTDTSEDAP